MRTAMDTEMKRLSVLIACEYSGIVRDSFIAQGHDAISCDLLPTERPGPHYQGDVRDMDLSGYDLAICHPPCTYLAVSGARWNTDPVRQQKQQAALDFVRFCMGMPMPRIAIENPIGVISTAIREPDQIIQPWQYGHGETKATCLWLKNLPLLRPTDVVEGREARIHNMAPSEDRGKLRSLTYAGIAAAFAAQWGNLEAWPVQAVMDLVAA